MAGKKKKTLANRLAKMSDEERARYLQHKADVEEEAKKRKEELISAFMKKKIKKEDAFTRLNLAKINQNWHQLLRRTKCQEMKKNVEHMKEWMNRVFEYKNRIISKLLKELEDAGEQYSYNFQAHSTHINNIIEEQNKYINKLQEQYDQDLEHMVESSNEEREYNKNTIDEDEKYLKTILYAQTTTAEKNLRQQYEGYMLKINEEKQLFNDEIKNLKKSRETISSAIWHQIATVIRVYVQQTDSRRMHFAELKMLDVESACEISKNQELIIMEEQEIQRLEALYNSTHSSREEQIQTMTQELTDLNRKFLKVRQQLKEDMAMDKNKLMVCSTASKEALDDLNKKLDLGEQLIILMKTCQKLETEREQVAKWLPIARFENIYGDEYDERLKEDKRKRERLGEEAKINLQDLEKGPSTSKIRPKTAFVKTPKSGVSTKSLGSTEYISTPESRRLSAVKSIKFDLKKSKSEERTTPEPEVLEDQLMSSFEALESLENFWFIYNKVNVDYIEMREEKKLLKKENKELRGMMRAILEAAVLDQSIPNTRASTRVPSQRRSAYSAPLRRIVF